MKEWEEKPVPFFVGFKKVDILCLQNQKSRHQMQRSNQEK